ncbi:MAG: hypothetical protein ABW123_21060 [Cystobacter sp.]
MNRRQRSRTVTELESEQAPATGTQAPPPPRDPDPLYGVALLKMALELKRQRETSPEDILRGVLARMRLSEVEFRAWLAEQGELSKVFGGP